MDSAWEPGKAGKLDGIARATTTSSRMAGDMRAQRRCDEQEINRTDDMHSERPQQAQTQGHRRESAIPQAYAQNLQGANMPPGGVPAQRHRDGAERARVEHTNNEQQGQSRVQGHRRRQAISGTGMQVQADASTTQGDTRAQARYGAEGMVRASNTSREPLEERRAKDDRREPAVSKANARGREDADTIPGDTRAHTPRDEEENIRAGEGMSEQHGQRHAKGQRRRPPKSELQAGLGTSIVAGNTWARWQQDQQESDTGGAIGDRRKMEGYAHGHRRANAHPVRAAPQHIRPLNTLAYPGHAGSLLDSDAYLQSQIPRRRPRRTADIPATAPAHGLIVPPQIPNRRSPAIPKPINHRPTPRNLLPSPPFEAARPLATDTAIGTDSMLAVHERMAAIQASSFVLQESVGMWFGGANVLNRTLISTATDGIPVMTPYQSFVGYDIPSNPFATDVEGSQGVSENNDPPALATINEAVADNTLADLTADGLDIEGRSDGASSVEITPERSYIPSRPAAGTLIGTPAPDEQSPSSQPKRRNPIRRLGKFLKKVVGQQTKGP